MARTGLHRALICLALAAIVALAFSPTLRNGFTGYDDGEYVTGNPHVNTGITRANFIWALTAAHSSNWHPLTWLSHALDCDLFGLAPAGHHAVSLLLHTLCTVLLFLWLQSATGFTGRSAFVALAFGLHPLHVESVAWVAARKDVLSTFFWIVTLIAYTSYARRPSAARYSLVAVLFTAGLLSKPMLVTLPLILRAVDWWPLGRTGCVSKRRLLVEKLPLFLLAGLVSAITLWAHRQTGSVAALEALPLSFRLSNAAVSYIRYLGKTVRPAGLAVFYPMPAAVPAWQTAGALLALAAISWLIVKTRGRHPWLAFGWIWYVVTLLPVIGIVQTGMQSMADRYMYVPMIGLLVAIAWECGEDWKGRRTVPAATATALLAVCAVLSWRQILVWKDGVTLFTHAIAVTGDNFVAHDNLGVELDRRGRFDEALVHYRETIRIKPGDLHGEHNFAQAVYDKGERLFATGRFDEALALFREGFPHDPRNPLARTYAGLILTERNQLADAIRELRQAVAMEPGLARAHMGLGIASAKSGDLAAGNRELELSLRLDPSSYEAYYNLGLVQAAMGRPKSAIASLDAALRLKPDFEAARLALGMLRGGG